MKKSVVTVNQARLTASQRRLYSREEIVEFYSPTSALAVDELRRKESYKCTTYPENAEYHMESLMPEA